MYYGIWGILIGKYEENLHYATVCSSAVTGYIKKLNYSPIPQIKWYDTIRAMA